MYDIYLFLICLLINPAVVILGVSLVSITIEIHEPDKVGTFIIIVKCFFFFFNYPKIGQGELTTLESQALFWINIPCSSGPYLPLFFLVSVISAVVLISIIY